MHPWVVLFKETLGPSTLYTLPLHVFNHIYHCHFTHAGYYTCVEVIFTLRRQVGFYMMGVYAPTLLIVVLSWLSFWINPDASAARVPLGEDHLKYIDHFHIFH